MRALHISYESEGSGHPLVLLHGIGSSARSWRAQVQGLSDIRRVIAWDAPGYGGSADPDPTWKMSDYARALLDFLDDLDLRRVDLVGLSFGGVVAAEFCRRHQERLSSLTLADTHQGGSAKNADAYRQKLYRRLQSFRCKRRDEFARERAPRLLSDFAPPDLVDDVAHIMEDVRSPGYEVAAYSLAEADVSDVLPKIYAPTLVLCGEFDQVTPPNEAEELAKAVPGARFEIVRGAGHLSNQEQPKRFNELLRRHVQAAQKMVQTPATSSRIVQSQAQ
jgi:pimeloyl-ACP methyl ester carboxylesterase